MIIRYQKERNHMKGNFVSDILIVLPCLQFLGGSYVEGIHFQLLVLLVIFLKCADLSRIGIS